ncbi:MAG TPA: CbiX/SirB N-terminal domain-containing protein [Verrucomicrobiae bacterium]|nr:CbiX/SirB N-terminal domain-containing protein [Verrucomicrobiae bacterium]
MANEDFSDAALVLVGHGSTLNADSSAPAYQHADTLRRRKIFAQVQECFWKLEPSIAGVLRGIFATRVFIVPLFISEGYFTEEIIPRELGLRAKGEKDFARVQRRDGQTLYYAGPVGTHASMTEVLLARARNIVAKHPFPRAPKPAETTLFIAGHGTSQNENSRQAIERQAALIRERPLYAACHAVFMEEEPRVGDCYAMAATKNLVMVPFFISDGLHSQEDIPVLLGETEKAVRERLKQGTPTWRNPTERHGKRLWYAPSIGTEPQLAEVIMERVREMAGEEWLRVDPPSPSYGATGG